MEASACRPQAAPPTQWRSCRKRLRRPLRTGVASVAPQARLTSVTLGAARYSGLTRCDCTHYAAVRSSLSSSHATPMPHAVAPWPGRIRRMHGCGGVPGVSRGHTLRLAYVTLAHDCGFLGICKCKGKRTQFTLVSVSCCCLPSRCRALAWACVVVYAAVRSASICKLSAARTSSCGSSP